MEKERKSYKWSKSKFAGIKKLDSNLDQNKAFIKIVKLLSQVT